jgi:hypothetical protein
MPATNGALSLKFYPLVTTGAGALPLPTKQPPKLSAVTTNASASATFFIEHLFFKRAVGGSISHGFSVAQYPQPPGRQFRPKRTTSTSDFPLNEMGPSTGSLKPPLVDPNSA